MTISVENNINKIDVIQWNALLENASTASIFQSKRCYDFYQSLSFMESFIFTVYEDALLKGVIVGYIQKEKNPVKQFFTKRAIINGGPMLADNISDDALQQLLNECDKTLKDKAIYVEFRNFNDYSKWKTVFEKSGFEYQPHYNFHVDTSSSEIVDSNMGKSRKRDTKTSLRDGAEIIEATDINQIHDFYIILKNLYKTKIKTPLFPFEFFEKLFVSPIVRYLLVKYQDKIIGGTVCVCLEKQAVYEWFACGEDGVYKNIYPSTLATFAGIYYAAMNGYKRFDMMGAGSPDDRGYGVRDFKAKFGGELVEQGRFLLVSKPLLYKIGSLGVKVLKSLK